jgi:hypothetical protein
MENAVGVATIHVSHVQSDLACLDRIRLTACSPNPQDSEHLPAFVTKRQIIGSASRRPSKRSVSATRSP